MSGTSRRNQDTIIRRLQSIMLTSVLEQQPLPGQSQPVRFPDLAWLTSAPSVLLSRDNVAGRLDLSSIEKSVHLTSEDEIREIAAQEGDRAYARFQPPMVTDDEITIVLEVRIAPNESELLPLGLGGIRATFTKTSSGDWEVTEPPLMLAI